MNLGLFYQSGYRIEACYHALAQFRKFYPDAPVALFEDNTDILEPIAKKFNCVYKKTDKNGFNDPNSGRPAYNLETMLAWINRVHLACTTTLSNVDWVVHFEDDVWFKRNIPSIPPYDLTGICGRGWDDELYNYLGAKVKGAHGCGGSIFNRKKFIEAYENSINIDWKKMDSMARDPKPSEWTDSALTLLFLYSKFTVGSWKELGQYRNTKIQYTGDRRTWGGTMLELENEQGDVSVIHCWKPYYYPTSEEKDFVKSQLVIYN
jgi:hypothetical protein